MKEFKKKNKIRKRRTEINLSLLAHLFPGEDVSCQFDLGEVAFADGFQQPVVTDVRLVVGRGRGDRVPTPWHAGAAG